MRTQTQRQRETPARVSSLAGRTGATTELAGQFTGQRSRSQEPRQVVTDQSPQVSYLAALEEQANKSDRARKTLQLRGALNRGEGWPCARPLRPVVQAVWEDKGGVSQWDTPIDGVSWFAQPETGLMWFQVVEPGQIALGKAADYLALEGKENRRSWEEWNLISVRPAEPEEGSTFDVNERAASWGSVWEVAPGVGVEVMSGEDPTYARFIFSQLQALHATAAGGRLLSQFDPRAGGAGFRQVKDQSGPYKGITVVIGQPPKSPQRNRLINTVDLGGRNPKGAKTFGSPRIPRINFFASPDTAERVGESSASVIPEGVVGHADFPKSIQPFDVVLFHELIHAYLSQLGVARRLRMLGDRVTNQLPMVDKPDAIEEQLVVGLLGGSGLPFSENAYRRERGYELRTTYQEVGLKDSPEAIEKELAADGTKSILLALRGAGLSKEQAEFVVGGPQVES